jgi:hypothetical protein
MFAGTVSLDEAVAETEEEDEEDDEDEDEGVEEEKGLEEEEVCDEEPLDVRLGEDWMAVATSTDRGELDDNLSEDEDEVVKDGS